MKRYETIVIIDPDLTKEAEAPIFDRVNDLIPQFDGFLIETDNWGTKKLAYEIKKKNRGHYVRLDFCGDGALIQEMERFFRIDDRVMKFMTVLVDADADLDAIKAALAEREAPEEKPAVAPAETEAAETKAAESEATESEAAATAVSPDRSDSATATEPTTETPKEEE